MTHQKAFCLGSDQRLNEIQTVGRIKMAASLKRNRGSCFPRLSMVIILCASGEVDTMCSNWQVPYAYVLPHNFLHTSSVNQKGSDLMGLLSIYLQ